MLNTEESGDRKMPEGPQYAEDVNYKIVADKIYKGDSSALDQDIRQMISDGDAQNRLAALRKIMRDKGVVDTDTRSSVNAYFLQMYRRSPGNRQGASDSEEGRGFSAFLAGPDGIKTVHIDKSEYIPDPTKGGLKMGVGEAQQWTELGSRMNLITGKSWLVATKDTRIGKSSPEQISQKLWNISKPITQIVDGLGLWQAYIAGIFTIAEFDPETGRRLESIKPILGDGGQTNLSVGLTDKIDKKTGRPDRIITNVKILTEPQLKTFLGPLYKEDALLEEDAAKELSYALSGNPVIVFGRGLTPNNPQLPEAYRAKMKKPTLSISNGLGVISVYPDQDKQ